MYELTVKFEADPENKNTLIKNEVEIYKCIKFECINDSMFGIAISEKEAVMIPIRRIHEIKIKNGD